MLDVKPYDNYLEGYRFIDLFSGIGGFHLALKSFGAECVYASDINIKVNKIYETNHGIKPKGDITLAPVDSIPEHDIVTAGFPCQAFSIAGKKLGFEETRGTLFFDVARIIKHHKPKIAILENVKNFAKHDNGKTLKVILNALDEIGYDTYYKVLNSADFHVPQARERIYIVAVRKNIKKEFIFPEYAKDASGNHLGYVCVNDIISADKELIKKISIDNKIHQIHYKPTALKNLNKPLRVGDIDGKGNSQGYRLYSPDSVGNTLTADGGGLGSNKGGPYYFSETKTTRVLSVKECCKLMGLPESFNIPENMKESYRQLGNSVVVNVVQEIVKELIVQKII